MTALAYDPADEKPKPDEGAAVDSIAASMRGILQTTLADYGHSVRGVHAKSHGLLQGEMEVLGGLPAELAQGIFGKPGRFPVVLRISTNPGDILDDDVSSPRGMAIKVIGVEGDRLPGSEGAVTQDFVMANAPAFTAPDAQGFSGTLKLLAATTDTGQAWKKGFSALLRGAAKLVTAAGGNPGPLKALGGQPTTNPLGETFYTQTPFRYGDHVAKLSLAPASPGLTQLTDAPVGLSRRPNGLRAAVIDHFSAEGGTWELRVQLRTDPDTMPIEDATVPWPEDTSPYRTVARITAGRQPAWNEARAQQVDDGLSFTPWNGVEAHRPLGSINRARRSVYALSAQFRASHNGCPIHEPNAELTLSDAAPDVYGTAPGREGRRPNTPDALPCKLGQPLNPAARDIAAGALGGLAASALMSAAFVLGGLFDGGRNELVTLKRNAARQSDKPKPTIGEQVAAHGGHLLLGGLAGAAFGAAKPAKAAPLVAGPVFGALFYAVCYGAIGPALRVAPPVNRAGTRHVAQHLSVHLAFGGITAWVAQRLSRHL